MDHPIITDELKSIRSRMVRLLRKGYRTSRTSNIIFVCGASSSSSMRMRFLSHCETQDLPFTIFLPEFAMEDYFKGEEAVPFNIATFEEIVGAISFAIVIFPEAAGSFAETGYFAAKKELAQVSLLILDSREQGKDGFISMGPAHLISEQSKFNPVMQMDYGSPNFEAILSRLSRRHQNVYKKTVSLQDFKDLSEFDLLGLIYKICDLLTIALMSDIEFILRSIFGTTIAPERIRRLTSILVGSDYLRRVGDYGHLAATQGKAQLFEVRDGYKGDENEIRLELTQHYDFDAEFEALVGSARDAA